MSPRHDTSKALPREEAREQRIADEIVVDAYGPEEQAMGWYCRIRRQISPLQIGDEVDVIAMADEDECEHEMFVAIRWGHRASDSLAVPLAQLDVIHAEDETTTEAVADWHYWDERYEF